MVMSIDIPKMCIYLVTAIPESRKVSKDLAPRMLTNVFYDHKGMDTIFM